MGRNRYSILEEFSKLKAMEKGLMTQILHAQKCKLEDFVYTGMQNSSAIPREPLGLVEKD